MSGCLKGHSYPGSHIPSTHKSNLPPRGVLQVMLSGDIAIRWVCAAKRKYVHHCWLLLAWYVTNDTCRLSNCEMVSQVKTPSFLVCQQVCIRNGIRQWNFLPQSNHGKCKIMLCRITGPYPIVMVSFAVGKSLDVGLSRPSSSDHIKYVKYVNYVCPHGRYNAC